MTLIAAAAADCCTTITVIATFFAINLGLDFQRHLLI